jgi:hypothetical protein
MAQRSVDAKENPERLLSDKHQSVSTLVVKAINNNFNCYPQNGRLTDSLKSILTYYQRIANISERSKPNPVNYKNIIDALTKHHDSIINIDKKGGNLFNQARDLLKNKEYDSNETAAHTAAGCIIYIIENRKYNVTELRKINSDNNPRTIAAQKAIVNNQQARRQERERFTNTINLNNNRSNTILIGLLILFILLIFIRLRTKQK